MRAPNSADELAAPLDVLLNRHGTRSHVQFRPDSSTHPQGAAGLAWLVGLKGRRGDCAHWEPRSAES